jgi:hypothetical protein
LLTLTSKKKKDDWQIQIIDSKGKAIKNLDFSQNLLARIDENFPIPNVAQGYLYFEYDSQYEEFVFCPKLHVGQKCAVIRDVTVRAIGIHLRTDKFTDLIRTFINPYYEIFEFSLTDENVDYLPTEWTTGKRNPLFLRNGIRISRNAWLQDAGPELVKNGEITHIWLDGRRIDFEKSTSILDLTKVDAGTHAIVVPQHSTIFFSIIIPSCDAGSRFEGGWGIANCKPMKENAQMIGVYLATTAEKLSKTSVSPVRAWINSILSTDSKNSNNTIVIKSLNRRKNGLRPR